MHACVYFAHDTNNSLCTISSDFIFDQGWIQGTIAPISCLKTDKRNFIRHDFVQFENNIRD